VVAKKYFEEQGYNVESYYYLVKKITSARI
jgi:hypothetical protein